MQYPIILGHEGAGIVESVGEGVSTVKTGMNWLGTWSQKIAATWNLHQGNMRSSDIKGEMLTICQKNNNYVIEKY